MIRRVLLYALSLIALSILFSSCASYKRCNRKFPIIEKDSLVMKDSIIIRDRVVYDTLEGDTSYIMVDTSFQEFPDQGITIKNDYAIARLTKENHQYKMELIQKDTTITRLLRGAEVEKSQVKEVYQTRVQQVKYIPKFYKFSLFWTIGTWVLAIIWVLFRYFKRW